MKKKRRKSVIKIAALTILCSFVILALGFFLDIIPPLWIDKAEWLLNGGKDHDAPVSLKDTAKDARQKAESLGSQLRGLFWRVIRKAGFGTISTPESVVTNDLGLQVSFIDVGQADCILIQNGEHAMLIDGGNVDDGPLVIDFLRNAGVTKLEFVIGTHAHEDHMGGLDSVINDMPVSAVIFPIVEGETYLYAAVKDAAIKTGADISTASTGNSYTLGDAVWTIVGCVPDNPENYNESSIIIKLTYGESDFLFTGDAELINEDALIRSGYDLDCEVLKVAHHGSLTSSGPTFLAMVSPEYAVISCGRNNDYGHPAKTVIKRLHAINAEVYRTDTEGTVIAVTDGTAINVYSLGVDPTHINN